MDSLKVKDIYVTAALLAKGCQLADTESIGSYVFFLVSPKEKAEQLYKDFINGELELDAKTLFRSLRDLKEIIANAREGQ